MAKVKSDPKSKKQVSSEVPSDGTVKIGGKTIKAKSAKQGATGVVHVTPKPQPPVEKPASDPIPAATEGTAWEEVGDNVHEAYAADLVDAGIGKFTGYVKFGGIWYDLREFTQYKDEDGIFYQKEVAGGKTLKVLI